MDRKTAIGVPAMTPTAEELEAIGGILDDLEIESIEDATVTSPISALDDETQAHLEAHLEADLARLATYESTEAPIRALDTLVPEEEVEGEEPVAVAPVVAKPPRKPSAAPKEPKAPKMVRNLEALPAEIFYLTDEAPADPEANKKAVLASKPLQTKIGEKFDNLFISLAAGRTPSVYVMDCFRILDAAKVVTSTELVAGLKATPLKRATGSKSTDDCYVDGTARSQAGQMMVLFHVLGVAKREGQKLTLIENSRIAQTLREMIATT